MLNKFKNIPFFWKLWICHITIYFELLAFCIKGYSIIGETLNLIKMIFSAPIIGLFGFGIFDGIGLLVFVSVIVSYLIDLIVKKTFISYFLSIIITYPIFIYYSNEGYGSYKLTITCLALTILINGIIFRKEVFKSKEV